MLTGTRSSATSTAGCGSLLRAWALLALLLAPLLGCGQPTAEPVTITFGCPGEDAGYYEALAKQFSQERPEVTVKLLPLSDRLIDLLNAADVDVLATRLSLDDWLEKGGLVELDAWVAQDKAFDLDDFYPSLLDLYRRDGKLWAIPVGEDFAVLYYNRDLCDRYEVPYLQPGNTWDDFVRAAASLRDPARDVYGYCPSPQIVEPILFVYQHGGRLADSHADPPRLTFDDPLVIEALEWYDGLIDLKHVAPTRELARQTWGGDSSQAFYYGVAAGKVGLWVDMYTARGGRGHGWREPWPFRWGMTTLPREREAATLAQAEALAISAGSEHPDICWQWLAFVTRQAPNRLAPARRSLASSAAFEQAVGAETAAVVRASLEDATVVPPYIPGFGHDLYAIWRMAAEQFMSGKLTPREAMEWAQQQVEGP